MTILDPLIREGRTPHPPMKNRILRLVCRLVPKLSLFLLMFLLSFHLFSLTPRFGFLSPERQAREQTIGQIMAVLERHPTGLAQAMKEELAEFIYEEAARYNYDPKIILALIAVESSFQNWSVSEKGAKGLMQIMPYVAQSLAQKLGIEWMGDRTLFNPFFNVRMGIHYLSELILHFNNLKYALVAYNYGPTYVRGLIEQKQPVPPEFYDRFVAAYQDLSPQGPIQPPSQPL
jgi:soluble lytic murein transglycosylase-like protein